MTTMGLHSSMGEPIDSRNPSNVVLGSDYVSPVTVASAYATLAAEGKLLQPGADGLRSSTADKKSLPVQASKCKPGPRPRRRQRRDQGAAPRSLTAGTGRGNQAQGRPAGAGKTGTTTATSSRWFVGYTPQLSTAVWVGTPHGPEEDAQL